MLEQSTWIMTLLVMARTFAFLSTLPVLRGIKIPLSGKLAITLPISIFIAHQIEIVEVETVLEFLGLLSFEVVVGLTLGFILELITSIVRMAGSLIDQDIGLANPFFDPNFNAQSTTVSRIYFYVFLLVFIVLGGIQKVIEGYSYTFQLTARTTFYGEQTFLDFLLDTIDFMFVGAVQIAIPFMMSTFLVYIALLMMSKTVDKINLLMNIFGIKIAVGMVMIFISIPVLIMAFEQVFESFFDTFLDLIGTMFER